MVPASMSCHKDSMNTGKCSICQPSLWFCNVSRLPEISLTSTLETSFVSITLHCLHPSKLSFSVFLFTFHLLLSLTLTMLNHERISSTLEFLLFSPFSMVTPMV